MYEMGMEEKVGNEEETKPLNIGEHKREKKSFKKIFEFESNF